MGKLIKKILFYLREILAQGIVFYLVLISPLGSFGESHRKFYSTYFNDIFISMSYSSLPSILSFPYFLFLSFIGSLAVSIIPISLNIYFLHFNKFRYGQDDYNILKILLMIISNSFYLLAWEIAYIGNISRNLGFPIFLTLIFYLIWKYIKEKRLEKTDILVSPYPILKIREAVILLIKTKTKKLNQ